MVDMNFQTDTWEQLVRYAKQELKGLHHANSDVGLNEAETNALRGEMRALQKIIDMPADEDVPVAPQKNEYI